ncbi:HD domain-containing protein [Duganella hordei]|uniref:HD domain-containing protein n=1 Tax=Duganella hordei TaxID=2865934 RepID=UPI0030E7C791
MDNNLQPLEEFVKEKLSTDKNKLPDRNVDYWGRYMHLLAGLREHVYKNINAGLASFSKSPGIYTDHGPEHFDEVIRYAGLLLNSPETGKPEGLEPYELYLLLCAIRLHDAGNIDGREEHERNAASILSLYGGNIVYDSPEFELISSIAQAHGGYTFDGDKDTIATLPPDDTPFGGITCRPRYVAALVRFADEICEHRNRAAGHFIRNGKLPDENKLYHYYASSITGAVPDRKAKSFRLYIAIDTKFLHEKYPTPANAQGVSTQKFLIDEITERLTKLDKERSYCNQFLSPGLQTNQVEVQIRLLQAKKIGNAMQNGEVDKFEFKIPSLTGYPKSSSWQHTELVGDKIAERAEKEWKNAE